MTLQYDGDTQKSGSGSGLNFDPFSSGDEYRYRINYFKDIRNITCKRTNNRLSFLENKLINLFITSDHYTHAYI